MEGESNSSEFSSVFHMCPAACPSLTIIIKQTKSHFIKFKMEEKQVWSREILFLKHSLLLSHLVDVVMQNWLCELFILRQNC